MSEPGRSRAAAAYFVATLVVAAGIAGLVAVLSASDDSGSSGADVSTAFAPRYENLEERRLAAGIPTMAEGGGEHFHAQLKLYADGREIVVPSNIGIDPLAPQTDMAGLHTHDTTGTVHNEAGTGATLGDFFAVWGVDLSATRLGPYSGPLRMWVDGKPSRALEDLLLEDGQEIVLASGPAPEDAGLPQ